MLVASTCTPKMDVRGWPRSREIVHVGVVIQSDGRWLSRDPAPPCTSDERGAMRTHVSLCGPTRHRRWSALAPAYHCLAWRADGGGAGHCSGWWLSQLLPVRREWDKKRGIITGSERGKWNNSRDSEAAKSDVVLRKMRWWGSWSARAASDTTICDRDFRYELVNSSICKWKWVST
jgi:hypothetical protein